MSLIKMLVGVALGSVIFSTSVYAGEKLADKMSKGEIIISTQLKGCDVDAKELCPGLPLGGNKSFMCLMAYEDKLSNPCKLGIAEAAISLKLGMAALDYSISSCEADADKYCLDVQPGEGRIVACIKKNKDKVSKSCVTALKQSGFWDGAVK